MSIPTVVNKPLSSSLGGPPLTRPSNAQASALERIEAKLDRIEAKLDRLEPLVPLLESAPNLVAMLGDTFDEWSRDLELDDRLRAAASLLERATRPDNLVQLERGLELLETLPNLVAMLGDTFDEFASGAESRGIQLERVVPELGRALENLLRLVTNEQVSQLFSSDLFLAGTLDVLSAGARALANAQRAPIERIGVISALRALRDPAVQRAIGFLIDASRRFGANVDRQALSEGGRSAD